MCVFLAIAAAAFLLLAGSFLFGHDVDHDHDVGGTEDVAHAEAGTVSIFSVKVVATLFMGFGAAGAIASHAGLGPVASAGIGLGSGFLLAGLMYVMLGLIYKQQSTSVVSSRAAVGCTGTVTVSIDAGAAGEVGLVVQGQYGSWPASAAPGVAIEKGAAVRVVDVRGGSLVVERETA